MVQSSISLHLYFVLLRTYRAQNASFNSTQKVFQLTAVNLSRHELVQKSTAGLPRNLSVADRREIYLQSPEGDGEGLIGGDREGACAEN